MRKLFTNSSPQKIKEASRKMSIEHNVTFNVIDVDSGNIVFTHEGHNAATNSLLLGIGHYLVGDGIYNQAYDMLSKYVPRYLSLGTMGLINQEQDDSGLPSGLGSIDDVASNSEISRLCNYISECPGFGADGYDGNVNNGRPYFGLGPSYSSREFDEPVYCELISDRFPRVPISFREIIPESQSEVQKTIDIIYSGMISTGALAQFRSEDSDYIFITEAGLWSRKLPQEGGDNGLLAGYRIVPPSRENWNLGTYVEGHYEGDEFIEPHYAFDSDPEVAQKQLENQKILKSNILKVSKNQIVQVIWKIQIGGLEQLGGISELYPSLESSLIWHLWDN